MTKVYVVTSRTFGMENFEQSQMIFSIHGVFENRADAAELIETAYRDIDNERTFHIAQCELNVPDMDEERSKIMMMQNTIFALRYAREGDK